MEMFCDLRSDTVTLPSEGMKRAMVDAPLGDDVLGDDPTIQRLESTIATMAGKDAGLFFPSGTQANQVAIHSQTAPGVEVIVERGAHIFDYEAGAPAALSGVQLHPIRTADGTLRVADLEAALRPANEHFPQTRLVCFENTHNGHGGRVVAIDTMERVAEWCRTRGLRLHLDGARLFNAVVASGVPLDRYAACADTVSLCLSKGLGAPIGTCLAGDRETIARARWIRKRWGGGMRQVGILGAAGLYALENNIERLADDHALARDLARGLAAVDGVHVDPGAVESNMVLVDVTADGWTAEGLAGELGKCGVAILAFGSATLRAVVHLDVPRDAGEVVPARFVEALKGAPS